MSYDLDTVDEFLIKNNITNKIICRIQKLILIIYQN